MDSFTLKLERLQDFEFKATFDRPQFGELLLDEPEPLGHGKGPNPARLLGVAVGNCLSASLLFCVEKAKLKVNSLHTEVEGFPYRNEAGRIRIKEFRVVITIDVAGADPERASRCLSLFEDYCTVTASVRKGIPVHISIQSPKGFVFLESSGEQ